MTKRKKIALAVGIPLALPVAAFLVTVLVILSFLGVGYIKDAIAHRGWTEIDYCIATWDVSLPTENVSIEYNYYNRGGFNGDGTEYTICKYSVRPEEFVSNCEADTKGAYVEKYNRILPCMKCANDKKQYIDESKLFTPDENFVWQSKIKNGNCTLLLAYDTQNDVLYIIEDFM